MLKERSDSPQHSRKLAVITESRRGEVMRLIHNEQIPWQVR